MCSSRLYDTHLNPLKTGLFKKFWQARSDVGIAASPLYCLGIELQVAMEGHALWVTERSAKIDVLHCQDASRPRGGIHSCQSLGRIAEMGEDKPGVDEVELFLHLIYGDI